MLEEFFNGLFAMATAGEYVVPFWAAVFLVLLLLNRHASLRLIWRKLHWFQDLRLQKEVIKKIDVPLQVLLVLLAVCPFLRLLPFHLGAPASRLCVFAACFMAVHVIVISVDLMIFTWYLGERKDANVPSVFRFVVLTVVYLGLGMLMLNATLGINVMPLLATSTVLTAVFGLAMQDTLKNLFAGLTMSFERRFRQGDWISFGLDPKSATVGQVTEIGWRTTKIRTLDENFAVIPNSQFTNSQLVNYSSPTPVHALYIEVPLALTADLEAAKKKVSKAIAGTAGISKEPAPELYTVGLKPDHIVCKVRFWIDDFSQRDRMIANVVELTFQALSELKALPGSEPADNAPDGERLKAPGDKIKRTGNK